MNGLKILLRLALLLLTINFSNSVMAENPSDWKLSPDGFGPIRIGMTLDQASKASGKAFTNDKPDLTYEDKSCFYSKFKDKDMQGVLLMLSDNKIVRIDVSSPSFATSQGARVGDTEAQLISLYGKLRIEPHHYDSQGKYFTYLQKDNNHAIRFETDKNKRVKLMYAGKYKEVQYVEGCL